MTETIETAIERFRALPPSTWLEMARTVLEVRAVLMLRGLKDEAFQVGTVGHVERNRRFSALASYAAARDDEARRFIAGYTAHHHDIECGSRCIWTGPGPCSCRAPEALQSLRRRQRAILWANQALMRE